MIQRLISLAALALVAQSALAQGEGGGQASPWPLFLQSFDLFSVVLITGSLLAVGIIARSVIDIRKSHILPDSSVKRLAMLVDDARWGELYEFVQSDESFPSRVVRAAMGRRDRDRSAIRESAELAASEEIATWFRKIEMLNVIGNLGPLVGLAGTVWGMIHAFTSLGVAGGLAEPSDLSLGISKALFHTLLGLCLAIPCLLVFGYYRSVIDRLCTRSMVLSAQIVEQLPATDDGEGG